MKKQLKLVEYSSTIKNKPKHQPGKVSQRTSMGVDLFVSPIFWYRSFSVSACVCVCVCMNVHTYMSTCITQNGRGREGRREGRRQGGKEGAREGDRERRKGRDRRREEKKKAKKGQEREGKEEKGEEEGRSELNIICERSGNRST